MNHFILRHCFVLLVKIVPWQLRLCRNKEAASGGIDFDISRKNKKYVRAMMS